jgi:glycosyltransferase involved in cell wall biosynthesis
LISSHIEGLSISMLEALASGLPVISTRVSGSSILVESPAAGLVVDVGNIKELAMAIETLLTNESIRIRLSKNARPLFESRFSLDTFSKTIILLYASLIDRKQKRMTA